MTSRAGDRDFLDAWGHAWSCGDPEVLLPFYADDATYTDMTAGQPCTGHDEIRRFYRWMLAFAPDCAVHFDEAHGDDSGLAARWVWTGTAAGPLRLHGQTHPATGRSFTIPGVAFCRLAGDGRFTLHEDYWDVQTLLRQLS